MLVDLLDLASSRIEVAIVRHHVVRVGDLLGERELRLDSRVGFGNAETVTGDQPQSLNRFLGADHDENGERFVSARFDEKRRLVDHIRRSVIVVLCDSLRSGRADPRMEDRVQRLSGFLVSEHKIADLLAVEAARFVEYVLPELLDDLLKPRRTRLDDLARKVIRVDYRYPEIGEHLGHGRLSARDPARQPYYGFHRPSVLSITPVRQDDSRYATPTPMRAVVQRVHEASVSVDGESVGAIGQGLLVYLGAAAQDGDKDVEYIANKIAGLRIFANDEGKMSSSVVDVGGEVLVVSQFTLFGDVRRGRRPSFDGAADPADAERLYLQLVRALGARGLHVETGRFRAMMDVSSVVDGPVTIQIDSRKLY